MCGFSDVRMRQDGGYYCQVCERDLGKDFGLKIALACGKIVSLQLSRQCSRSPTSQESKP